MSQSWLASSPPWLFQPLISYLHHLAHIVYNLPPRSASIAPPVLFFSQCYSSVAAWPLHVSSSTAPRKRYRYVSSFNGPPGPAAARAGSGRGAGRARASVLSLPSVRSH
eukprot:751261-Hanusia_phi.AAC.3